MRFRSGEEFDYHKLIGLIYEGFGSLSSFADALGIATPSLVTKLKNETRFSQDEIWESIKVFDLSAQDTVDAFFRPKWKSRRLTAKIGDKHASLGERKAEIAKLGELEDIEGAIGIPLAKLYEAQTKGIYVLRFKGEKDGKPVYEGVKTKSHIWIDFKRKALVGVDFDLKFSDYGKTWAIYKEELEGIE